MIEVWGLVFVVFVAVVVALFGIRRVNNNVKKISACDTQKELSEVRGLLNATINAVSVLANKTHVLDETVKITPTKVLETIKGSANKLRGDLGEFIQYTRLKADYDLVIPLGDVVDFICVKFPTEKTSGYLDFVEVKTNSSRLSQNQKYVKDIVMGGKIGFKSIRVVINDINRPESK